MITELACEHYILDSCAHAMPRTNDYQTTWNRETSVMQLLSIQSRPLPLPLSAAARYFRLTPSVTSRIFAILRLLGPTENRTDRYETRQPVIGFK